MFNRKLKKEIEKLRLNLEFIKSEVYEPSKASEYGLKVLGQSKLKTAESEIESLNSEVKFLKSELFDIKYPNGKLVRDNYYDPLIRNTVTSVKLIFTKSNNTIELCRISPESYSITYAVNRRTILIKIDDKIRRFEMDFDKQVAVEVEFNEFNVQEFEFIKLEN